MTSDGAGTVAPPRHSFTVVAENEEVFRNCMTALSHLVVLDKVPNLVRVLDVVAHTSCETPSAAPVHSLTVSEESIRGVALEELATLLRQRHFRALTLAELACLATDVLVALSELHAEHSILHNAVNLRNIVLDMGHSRACLRPSLLCEKCLSGETTATSPCVLSSLSRLLDAEEEQEAADSLYWCAPEVFTVGQVDFDRSCITARSFASDVFSLGVTLLHLVLSHEEGHPESRLDTSSYSSLSAQDRVVDCVFALQGACEDDDAGKGDVDRLEELYGDAFVRFLQGCLQRNPDDRLSATELLHTPLVDQHNAQCETARREILATLMTDMESCLRGRAVDAAQWTAPIANRPKCWAQRIPGIHVMSDVVAHPPPAYEQEEEEHGAMVESGDATADVPPLDLPAELRTMAIAPSPQQLVSEREGDTPPPTHGQGDEHAAAASSGQHSMVDTKEDEEEEQSREDCAKALQDALAMAQSIMKEAFREERRRAVQEIQRAYHHQQQQQQQQQQQISPTSTPETPSSPQGVAFSSPEGNVSTSSNANVPIAGGGTLWTPRIPSPAPTPTPTARCMPAASLRASVREGSHSSSQNLATPAVSQEELRAASRRAEKIHVLLRRMANEAAALQALAPEFASQFCEELAKEAMVDRQTLSYCTTSVADLVPSLAPDSASATAEEEAARWAQQREEARMDFSKPLRTAREWAQALSMPHTNRTVSLGGPGSKPLVVGVGGSAGALLYNKWLKEHQKKAAHLV